MSDGRDRPFPGSGAASFTLRDLCGSLFIWVGTPSAASYCQMKQKEGAVRMSMHVTVSIRVGIRSVGELKLAAAFAVLRSVFIINVFGFT